MIDLEERLREAGRAVQAEVDRIPVRSASVFSRRIQRRTAITYTAGLVAASLLFVAVAVVLTGGPPNPVASQPGDQSPLTYTVNSPDWELIAVGSAGDGLGTTHTLFDQKGSGSVPRQFAIDTETIAADRRNALNRAGLEPTASFSFGGAEATIYERTRGALGFASIVALWTRPDGAEFAFLFEGVDIDEIQDLISSLEPVYQEDWQSMLAQYEPPVTTTILAEHNSN